MIFCLTVCAAEGEAFPILEENNSMKKNIRKSKSLSRIFHENLKGLFPKTLTLQVIGSRLGWDEILFGSRKNPKASQKCLPQIAP